MNLRRTTAAAALVIGAMTVAMGTSHADPAPAPAADQPINYSVKLVDKTVVTTLRGGTFALTQKDGATPEDPKIDVVDILDGKGNKLVTLPMEFDAAGTGIPVKSELKKDGTVLEITPDKPEGFRLDKPVAVKPVASAQENQRAQNDFSSKFGIGTAIGGFVGTAVGAIIGCVVTIPAGCLPGLVTGAGVGGILGTIAIGGPTLVAAGIELISVMQAPENTTAWSDKKPEEVKKTEEAPK
ncbi:glycine zipper family protein [Nocardia takedensis]|uniref:glycine zipper family protein n=1 Tax=Nocardia takedensis TaxID=259390 RepID=UPI00030C35B2|nr:glycine zipper family protein [Nocardia takedensis]